MLGRLFLIVLMVAALLLVLSLLSKPLPRGVGQAPLSVAHASTEDVRGSSSLSADFVDQVLQAAGSPAFGLGQVIYNQSTRAGIDDAFVLAFFGHESRFGTLGVAVRTHSWGNLICTAGFPSCLGRYRSYPSFAAGLADFLALLTREYVPRGLTTLEAIIPVYAPASENNVSAYMQAVRAFVSAWREGQVKV